MKFQVLITAYKPGFGQRKIYEVFESYAEAKQCIEKINSKNVKKTTSDIYWIANREIRIV